MGSFFLETLAPVSFIIHLFKKMGSQRVIKTSRIFLALLLRITF